MAVARCVLTAALVVLACLATDQTQADEPALPDAREIAATLAQPILPPGLPVAELRAFLEPRIVRFDPASTPEDLDRLRARALELVFRGQHAPTWRGGFRVELLERLSPHDGYSIQKLRYEALPGLWIPALLYLPDPLPERLPAVLNLSGHEAEGMIVDYKQLRYINLARRGIAALAIEWFGMGQLRTPGFNHYKLNQLDLCGESGFAPFYLAMQNGFDLLRGDPRCGVNLSLKVDPTKIAVTGLSGGGLQTIFLAALEPAVAAADPVAGYCSLRSAVAYDDLGDSEHCPSDLAAIADFTHLTAMVAPRPLLLTYNAKDDCCFQAAHALPELLAAARPAYAARAASDKLHVHVNETPGTHNYERENREAFYRFLATALHLEASGWPAEEIDCAHELLSAEALQVPLPDDNLDLHQLARKAAEAIAARRKAPEHFDAREARERLARVLRETSPEVPASDPSPFATPAGADKRQAETLRLALPPHWTLPLVRWKAPGARTVVIVVDDAGMQRAAERIHDLLAGGAEVVAVDPLFVGQTQPLSGDPWYLWAINTAAVGARPLAIQARQLQAVAGWLRSWGEQRPIELDARGPRMSITALVAAALSPEPALAGVHLREVPATLAEMIEQNRGADELPELFAFGLLAEFDVRDLARLAPHVTIADPTPRHQAWLNSLGKTQAASGLKQ